MAANVLVILGAGAARDLIPIVANKKLGSSDEMFLPPLTAGVFADGPLTKQVLDLYSDARTLAGEIRIRLIRGEQLEPLLKSYSDIEVGAVAQQFPQVPLYLQDLFARISSNYTNQPINYQTLAHTLINSTKIGRVAFVTLNYDTLLDDVLAPTYLGDHIRTMRSYVQNPRCMLVKLHGSVNWAVPFGVSWNPPHTVEGYLDLLRDLSTKNLRTMLDYGRVGLRDPTADRWEAPNDGGDITLYYPALSVPVGDYKPVFCPADHLHALRRFLPKCDIILVIGVSGRDGDLFEELRQHLPEQVFVFMLVAGSKSGAEDASQRFLDAVPQIQSAPFRSALGNGFSNFVLGDGGLDKFLADIDLLNR